MQTRKIFFLLINIVIAACSVRNEKKLSNKQTLVDFQKELINN